MTRIEGVQPMPSAPEARPPAGVSGVPKMKPLITLAYPTVGGATEFFSVAQALELATAARNKALDEAAAIARANTMAPRIWRDGRWIAPVAEEIAAQIEARRVKL